MRETDPPSPRPNRARIGARRRVAAWSVLLAALLTGCEAPAFIAQSVGGGKKIPAVHTLEDRPTLVMIDDPNNLMGNPMLSGIIAANTAHHLRENGVLSKKIIPEKELAALKVKMGSDYPRTPIDRIGREVGAEQVLYASIDGAALQAAPGFYRPVAMLEVKVIDAVTGKRLYPEPPPIHEPSAPSRGRTLQVQVDTKSIMPDSAGTDAMLARQLAEEIGLQLAQLFYEHAPPPKFDN